MYLCAVGGAIIAIAGAARASLTVAGGSDFHYMRTGSDLRHGGGENTAHVRPGRPGIDSGADVGTRGIESVSR